MIACACGRTIGAQEWDELPSIGTQEIGVDLRDDWMPHGGTLDLKNCPACRSTVAKEITKQPTQENQNV